MLQTFFSSTQLLNISLSLLTLPDFDSGELAQTDLNFDKKMFKKIFRFSVMVPKMTENWKFPAR